MFNITHAAQLLGIPNLAQVLENYRQEHAQIIPHLLDIQQGRENQTIPAHEQWFWDERFEQLCRRALYLQWVIRLIEWKYPKLANRPALIVQAVVEEVAAPEGSHQRGHMYLVTSLPERP